MTRIRAIVSLRKPLPKGGFADISNVRCQISNGGAALWLRQRCLGFRLLFAASAAALLVSASAQAHDYWIDADTLRPSPGASLDVWVAGGHDFPEVELALQSRMLQEVSLVGPDRKRTEISVHVGEDKRHKGAVAIPDEPGVYLLNMVIRNPRQQQPQYVGRAILLAPGADVAPAAYALGEGIEIVPQADLARPPEDGHLPVSVHKDGQPVSAALTVYPAGGKPRAGRATAKQPAMIAVEPGRKYLITARVERVTVSLVFEVGHAQIARK